MRSLVLAAVLSCVALTGCELFESDSAATVQVKKSDCSDCTLDVDLAADGFDGDIAAEAICADVKADCSDKADCSVKADCSDKADCSTASECDGPSDCSIEWVEECDEPAAPMKDGGPN